MVPEVTSGPSFNLRQLVGGFTGADDEPAFAAPECGQDLQRKSPASLRGFSFSGSFRKRRPLRAAAGSVSEIHSTAYLFSDSERAQQGRCSVR
jgi:hypothetical protein